MGTFALVDARVEVNSVDLSGWVTSVTLPIELEALENTAMGQVARSRQAGLQDSTLGINFNDDFAASAVDATLWAAFGTVVVVKVRPTTGAISGTNPEFVASYLVNQHNPFGNSVGELATRQVSWPLSDPDGVARNTA
ncbi:radical SAM protein [Micromonospora sp. WMMD1082]|uniref:radical SAM protein n=1 Tax=Micromonospora sp. WMMD1082 TaxID=3016104 RepID=UPI002415B4A6|nr:radical SAM protein [Micromonospora sp. WMMD1082]MDG4796215.1 radical SAM protein [Micromonospora sp. WMMD1082]